MRYLLAATLATIGAAEAQVASTGRVATLARAAMARTGARGLAIAVVDRGRLVSAQAFGVRNAKGAPAMPTQSCTARR
ncbi:hypothetical protein AB5I41_03470 [Sphingomonas sp. MMS24-JH45]